MFQQCAYIKTVLSAVCWSGITHTCQCTLPSASCCHQIIPLPPPAHTCSLGTKWMLQSHLIGLRFRIQGHLKCFLIISLRLQSWSWQCLGRLYFVVNGCIAASGHQAVLVLILWSFVDYYWRVLGFLFFFFSFVVNVTWTVSDVIIILVNYDKAAHVLATSSVPFLSLPVSPLPLLWLSQR